MVNKIDNVFNYLNFLSYKKLHNSPYMIMSEEEGKEDIDPTLVITICFVDMISFTPSKRETKPLLNWSK